MAPEINIQRIELALAENSKLTLDPTVQSLSSIHYSPKKEKWTTDHVKLHPLAIVLIHENPYPKYAGCTLSSTYSGIWFCPSKTLASIGFDSEFQISFNIGYGWTPRCGVGYGDTDLVKVEQAFEFARNLRDKYHKPFVWVQKEW